jgi:hypothetical protein
MSSTKAGSDLPTVDDILTEWKRPVGKKGPLTKTQQAERDENAAKRAIVADLLDRVRMAEQEADRLHQRVDAQSVVLQQWRRDYDDAGRHNQQLEWNCNFGVRALGVLAELTFLMSDDEFTTEARANMDGYHYFVFTNSYGVFELKFFRWGNPTITVTPADTKRSPIDIELDSSGLTPAAVLMLRGHLGLPDDGNLPKRAAQQLRQEPAESQADLPGCGNPNCPVCSPNNPLALVFQAAMPQG